MPEETRRHTWAGHIYIPLVARSISWDIIVSYATLDVGRYRSASTVSGYTLLVLHTSEDSMVYSPSTTRPPETPIPSETI